MSKESKAHGYASDAEWHAAQQQAASQSATTSAGLNNLFAQAAKPDPLVERWRAMVGNNLNFFGVSDPAKPDANKNWTPDYDLSRTNKDGTPVFQGGPVFANAATTLARARREEDRTGTGAVGLGSYGADPGQLAQLKESRIRHAGENASLAAADAVDEARRETLGAILPTSAATTSRMGTAGGIGSSAYGAANAQTQSLNQHLTTPAWQTALQVAGAAAPFFLKGTDKAGAKGKPKTSTVWSGDRGSNNGAGVYA